MKDLRFQISDQNEPIFEQLKSDTGHATDQDLFNEMFAVYCWTIRERKSSRNRIIASLDMDTMKYKELEILLAKDRQAV